MAKKGNSNKMIVRLLIGIVAFIGILFLAKAMGWIGKPRGAEVELGKVARKTIVEIVSASGTVQPVTEVRLAPEVSGEIRQLLVEEGDSVSRGTMLVKIRPDTWESQLERAEAALSQQLANLSSSRASLERAKATYEGSKSEFERQEKLWNNGVSPVISGAEWDVARQNFAIAKNDLKSAEQAVRAAEFIVQSSRAAVHEAEENVRLTTVLAPMDGIVSKLDVKKGERVVGTQTMAGTEMMRIANLNVMEVRVDVNENDIVRVHEGDTAIIEVDAYVSQDLKFKGVVTLIANTAKEKVSSDAITEFEVRILILRSSYANMIKEGNKFPFRPGMTASVDIQTNRKVDVLSVPLSAVTVRNPNAKKKKQDRKDSDDEQQKTRKEKEEEVEVVFLYQEGKAKLVKVKTGISDFDNIEIIAGLQEGDRVVTGPFLAVSKKLEDGDFVNEKEEERQEDK